MNSFSKSTADDSITVFSYCLEYNILPGTESTDIEARKGIDLLEIIRYSYDILLVDKLAQFTDDRSLPSNTLCCMWVITASLLA